MKKLYQYALMRFMPFVETGEFANVGVLLCCPETGYWGYMLAPTRFARVTGFFQEMDKNLYKIALQKFEKEMHITQKIAGQHAFKEMTSFFTEITRPRQALIQFSNVRSMVADVGDANLLDKLYKHYIKREFATEQYREQQLLRAVKQKIKNASINIEYKEKVFKPGVREVRIPLVGDTRNGVRLIRPLAFYHSKPTMILEHGEQWINRMRALIKEGFVDAGNILLPIDTPNYKDADKEKAFNEVMDMLNEYKLKTVLANEDKKLIKFAAAES